MFTFLFFSEKLFSQFVDHVMIRQSGIYTLMDFKPVSLIDMTYSPPSKEERYKIWHDFPDEIKIKHSVNDIFFPSYHCPKILTKWQKLQDRYVGNKYRFVPDGRGELYFINVSLTLSIIEEYAPLFKATLGEEISSMNIVESIGDSSSPIWKKIQKGHLLRGLLFGYGFHNSLQFERRCQGEISKDEGMISSSPTMVAIANHPKITSLNIPPFRVFEGGEDQVEKYKKKRTEILSQCEEEGFYSLVKRYLKQEYP